MEKFVVLNGATTKCTGSEQSSFLIVPPDFQIEVDGLNPATIAHHLPDENIVPFGPCKYLGGNQCVPATLSPWDKGEPSVPFGPDPSLNMDSHLKCKRGGEITLDSSGQGRPFFSTDNEHLSLAARAKRRDFYDRWLEGQLAVNELIEWLERPDIAEEIVKEVSGYNDAVKAIEAAKEGDIKGALLHGALAVPISKPAKGAKGAVDLAGAARGGQRRFVEVVTAAPISGASRSAHRTVANRNFAEALKSDPAYRRRMNEIFGQDVLEHMESGKSALKNPPGTEWHHPINRPDEIQLLRKEVHRDPDLQPILHDERGRGGYHKYHVDR